MTRWVLLRGLAREAAHWGPLPAALQARLGPGHRVLALDLPASGAWHEEAAPLDVGRMAALCRERAGPERGPTVLVGLSLGGMVAVEWARRWPGEVGGCALVNSSGGGLVPFWQRLRPARYPGILRMLLAPGPPAAREALILQMTSATPERHADRVASWVAIDRKRPFRAGNALRQIVAAARHRIGRSAPPVPMLLLASRGDGLVSPACSIRLAHAWGLPLHLHDWAGHDLPLDDGDWLIEQLVRWWTGDVAPSPKCHGTATLASCTISTLRGSTTQEPS